MVIFTGDNLRRALSWPPDTDLVQHISLPLELLGLFLTWVEVFHPRFNLVVEYTLDAVGERSVWRQAFGLWRQQHSAYSWMLTVSLGLATVFFVVGLYALFSRIGLRAGWWTAGFLALMTIGAPRLLNSSWPRTGALVYLTTLLPRMFLSLIANVLLYLLSAVFRFFDALGKGRAIGGMGLTLGGLGLSGEVYQVIHSETHVEDWWLYWLVIASVVIVLRILLNAANERTG